MQSVKVGQIDQSKISRVIGCKWRKQKTVETRSLTPAEVKEIADVVVQIDSECTWTSRSGGCGWDSLLVVTR